MVNVTHVIRIMSGITPLLVIFTFKVSINNLIQFDGNFDTLLHLLKNKVLHPPIGLYRL